MMWTAIDMIAAGESDDDSPMASSAPQPPEGQTVMFSG